MQINSSSISAVVGDAFAIKNIRGNFRVDIAVLKGSTDEERAKLMLEAAEKLRDEGVEVTYRASFNSGRQDDRGQDIWIPWQCLWVNTSTTNTSAETNAVLEKQDKKIDQLTTIVVAMAAAAGIEVPVIEDDEEDETPPADAEEGAAEVDKEDLF